MGQSNVAVTPGSGAPISAWEDGSSNYLQQMLIESGRGALPVPFQRFMDTTGDGSGTTNAVGDYSSVLDEFKFEPGVGTFARIFGVSVFIEDAGTVDVDTYGALAALTNGIELQVRDGGGLKTGFDFTNGSPIKKNGHWGRNLSVEVLNWGSGNKIVNAWWSFSLAGIPLRLDQSAGEYLAVRLNDDFTGLVSHYFTVHGYTESE